MGSLALKTNRICALHDIPDSTAAGLSISIRIFDFLWNQEGLQLGSQNMQGISISSYIWPHKPKKLIDSVL